MVRVLKENGFKSWDEFRYGNNHKVRCVIPVELDTPVPVYDLEVDQWHNFALSAGVFVHNSKDLADAVAGAVYNCVTRSPRNINDEVDIHDYDDVRLLTKGVGGNDITKKPPMPSEIEEFLISIQAL